MRPTRSLRPSSARGPSPSRTEVVMVRRLWPRPSLRPVRRFSIVGLVAAVLVALLAGIAWGGHPNLLPGFLRDSLVGDKQTRVVREALDKIHDVYYRQVP